MTLRVRDEEHVLCDKRNRGFKSNWDCVPIIYLSLLQQNECHGIIMILNTLAKVLKRFVNAVKKNLYL